MKVTTPLSQAMGLQAPIIQAPIAGGPSSQELVAACSAAGALGSFGFAYTQPEEMKKQAAWVRSKTDRPFCINLFTSPQPEEIDAAAQGGAPQAHKDSLLAALADETRITEKFSGKPARGLANRFIREMNAKNAPQLAFPAQNSVTGKLRQASAKAGKPDFIALWAGQAAPLSRALPAARLIKELTNEAIAAIRATAATFKE